MFTEMLKNVKYTIHIHRVAKYIILIYMYVKLSKLNCNNKIKYC